MDDRVAAVQAALEEHPAVRSVHLGGSRAEGREHGLSDWDLVVDADDFPRLVEDLPRIARAQSALHCFWDPYSEHDSFIAIFSGPTKLDVCFFDQPREYEQPYEPSAETLQTMDSHFWDWILWTAQKELGGKNNLMEESLALMYTHMLKPMGVEEEPLTVRGALAAYLEARDRLEQELGVKVDRTLEREVRPVID